MAAGGGTDTIGEVSRVMGWIVPPGVRPFIVRAVSVQFLPARSYPPRYGEMGWGHVGVGMPRSVPGVDWAMLPLAASGSARHPQSIRTLVMTAAQRDVIIAHLRAALPNEGVALLAVPAPTAEGRAEVAHIFLGTNIEASPFRFTMDPMEVVSADREMRRRDWVLGAIAHSHVASPATPSAADLREAFYPAALLLIVSFSGYTEGRSPEFGAWRIDEEGETRLITQVPIQVLT